MKKLLNHSKRVVHHAHHPHLKRRLVLEILGFVVIVPIIWHERIIIGEAIEALRSSDILFLGLAIALYWAMQPLSAISLRILASKSISVANATLTRIAGSGPGRIIPGGLGAVSLDVMHLKKSPAKVVHNHALSIVATQQIVAIATNGLLVLLILLFHDAFRHYVDTVIPSSLWISMTLVSLLLISLFLWLHHIRRVRQRILPVEKYIRKLLLNITTNPRKGLKLTLLALIIVFANSALLVLSSLSLGVHMNIWDAVIAMSSGVLIGGIVPTPGGIGIVEAGITASLIALGYDPAHAAGVAILFRVITYWLPLIPGTLAYMYLVDKKII